MKRYNIETQLTSIDPSLRDFRLRDIEIFSGAARLGSFRMAARTLRVEPSQVSRTAYRIEKQVGKKLFQRSAAGVSLTPAGERVNETFQVILNQAHFLKEKPRALVIEPTFYGIASANYIIQNLLPEALSQVSRKRPEVRFRLLELFPDEMLVPGLRGAFEICLHAGTIDWPATWQSQKVGSIEWGFFVSSNHPLVKRQNSGLPALRAEDLLEYPFILPFDFSIEDGYRFRDDKSPIAMHLRTSGYELQRADVAVEVLIRTQQIAHLPSIVALRYLQEKKIAYLALPQVTTIEVPLILSVQAASVSKNTNEVLVESLKRLLKDHCNEFKKLNLRN